MLLIVLTENSWLFTGLSALLPEMACQLMKFGERRLPWEVKNADRVMVVVDSLIFFRGEWRALNALRACRPDITVVWLMQKNTGRVFPAESLGERLVAQGLDIVSLRFALRRASQWAEPGRDDDYVSATELSPSERCLLPYFISGMSVHFMSRLTGVAAKTLHTHRHKILAKTGFRKLVFLQFVYERNGGLPGIHGLYQIGERENVDKRGR